MNMSIYNRCAKNAHLKIWWRASRPFSYPASIVPAILGCVVAWVEGYKIDLIYAIAALIGAVAVQAGANLLADYFDFKCGQDRTGTMGGSGVIVDGSLSARAVFLGAVVAFSIASIIAISMILRVGGDMIWLIVAGAILGAGYSFPPLGLKYRALGDISVFAGFGIGITLGSHMVQSGAISMMAFIASMPMGLLIAAILHANNIRDVEDDVKVSVRTLPIIVGVYGAKRIYALLVFGAYLSLAISTMLGAIPLGSLSSFITLPIAIRSVARVWRAKAPYRASLIDMDGETAKLNLAFGVTMIIGMIAVKTIGG